MYLLNLFKLLHLEVCYCTENNNTFYITNHSASFARKAEKEVKRLSGASKVQRRKKVISKREARSPVTATI